MRLIFIPLVIFTLSLHLCVNIKGRLALVDVKLDGDGVATVGE